MLDDYQKEQPIVYKMLKNSVLHNRYSHAYLFETNGYPKKMDIVFAFAQFLLCPNHYTNKTACSNCTQCDRIKQGSFSEIKLIEPDGLWIKKEQLESLQEEFSKTAVESNKKVYIINEADKLNVASANSILKFLEEPEPNIIAILVVDNMYQLLDTIISRCQLIRLNQSLVCQSENELERIAHIMCKSEDEIQAFLENSKMSERIDKVVSFALYYEMNRMDTLLHIQKLWLDTFNDKESTLWAIQIMILFYKDVIHNCMCAPIEIFISKKALIDKISHVNDLQQLCYKIKILLEMKEKIKNNPNISLFMDQLIMKLERRESHV